MTGTRLSFLATLTVATLLASPAATAAALTTAATASTSTTGVTRSVVVYYLGDTTNGPRLFREVHGHPFTTGVVRQAVNAMLHDAPRDPDYVSVWPAATTIRGISISNNVATIDFSRDVVHASVGGAFELMALQQVVYTVRAAAPAVTGVHVRIGGHDVATLWGHADTRGILKPGKAFEVLAPVQINSPGNGATVTSPVTVRGVATVWEATVSWQILAGGVVIKHGYVTASTGAPGRGTWSFVVRLAKGRYLIKAFEASAKDGSELFRDTKAITVG